MSKLLTPIEVVQALQDGKQVEYKHPDLGWCLLKPNKFKVCKLFFNNYQFRLAEGLITVGDVSFPKPEIKPLKKGKYYFIVDITRGLFVKSFYWCNDSVDKQCLQRGLIHLTEENAISHAKALIKLSGGSYE